MKKKYLEPQFESIFSNFVYCGDVLGSSIPEFAVLIEDDSDWSRRGL